MEKLAEIKLAEFEEVTQSVESQVICVSSTCTVNTTVQFEIC